MKKIASIATMIAASMALAASLQANEGSKASNYNSCEQTPKSIYSNKKRKKSKNLVDNLWKPNLTPTQTQQLLDILIKHSSDQQQISDAFSQESFDKEKFVQILKQKREVNLIRQADIISKAYAILTIEKREAFVDGLNKSKRTM